MDASELTSFAMRSSDVSAERLDGDVIIVNLASGAYFSLSGSAADVWTAATSRCPADVWLAALDSTYGGQVPRGQVAAFLAQCIEHGLIEIMPAASTEAPMLPDDYPRSGWTDPIIDVFTDLQDLLLLDPIHDANDLGWPQAGDR